MKNTKRTSWVMAIIIMTLFLIPYLAINHLQLDRNTLPFIFGEEKIPFLAWTFLVYISNFEQGIIVVRYMPRWFLREMLGLAVIITFIGFVFFVVWPINYPRELWPSTNWFVQFFRSVDDPANCFPSLHIAMAFFMSMCYSLFEKSKTRKVLMWLWTILISVSVLTTKQHYLIDVIAGIILALPFMWLAKKKWETRALNSERGTNL